jgi:hypothetical protein
LISICKQHILTIPKAATKKIKTSRRLTHRSLEVPRVLVPLSSNGRDVFLQRCAPRAQRAWQPLQKNDPAGL